jgi:uncharacterized protein YjiS (DUF1127 family)
MRHPRFITGKEVAMTEIVTGTPPTCAPARRHQGLFRRMLIMAALRRQRQALAQMDAHRLRDLGISHADARAEAARPIWDLPPGWRA